MKKLFTNAFNYTFAFFLFYVGPAVCSWPGALIIGVLITLAIVFGAARLVPLK